jgi:hypothetical protein
MALSSGGSVRLIRETLDSVVAPAVRDALISTALDGATGREVPADPEQFRSFVEGPLRAALVQGLGNELAESIVEELERMAQLTDSPPSSAKPLGRLASSPPPRQTSPRHHNKRSEKGRTLPTGITPPELPASGQPRSRPPSRPPSDIDPTATTVPPPSPGRKPPPRGLTPPPFSGMPISGEQSRPGTGWGSDEYPAGAAGTVGMPGAAPDSSVRPGRPHVLVASTDATLLRRLTPWLDATAELVPLASLRELVKDLEVLEEGRIVVLVDCRRPSIRPTAVAALADELPPNVSVVLWGASPEQERGVLAVSSSVNRWIVLHGETRPKELAARCADLVG